MVKVWLKRFDTTSYISMGNTFFVRELTSYELYNYAYLL